MNVALIFGLLFLLANASPALAFYQTSLSYFLLKQQQANGQNRLANPGLGWNVDGLRKRQGALDLQNYKVEGAEGDNEQKPRMGRHDSLAGRMGKHFVSDAIGCNCPEGCIVGTELTASDAQSDDVVFVECSEKSCPQLPLLHKRCFEKWEKHLLRELHKVRYTRDWTDTETVRRLWGQHGYSNPYQYVYRSCQCKCGGQLKSKVNDTAVQQEQNKKKLQPQPTSSAAKPVLRQAQKSGTTYEQSSAVRLGQQFRGQQDNSGPKYPVGMKPPGKAKAVSNSKSRQRETSGQSSTRTTDTNDDKSLLGDTLSVGSAQMELEDADALFADLLDAELNNVKTKAPSTNTAPEPAVLSHGYQVSVLNQVHAQAPKTAVGPIDDSVQEEDISFADALDDELDRAKAQQTPRDSESVVSKWSDLVDPDLEVAGRRDANIQTEGEVENAGPKANRRLLYLPQCLASSSSALPVVQCNKNMQNGSLEKHCQVPRSLFNNKYTETAVKMNMILLNC